MQTAVKSIGSILGEYGNQYIAQNSTNPQERGLIHLLPACRTAGMGSHYERCSECGHTSKAYNSCRNRHCPTCQNKDKLEWLDKRMSELLPVGYYHLVFTIPHELNDICFQNKKVMFGLLFKAVSQAIMELTKDTKHLGADTGLISILHSWGQSMSQHPHLHCIMPAGGLSFDKKHWVHITKPNGFFIHNKILSQKFKGKYLALLKQIFNKGELSFYGNTTQYGKVEKFDDLLTKLRDKKWVVNVQKPFGNPEKVLEYLSRYVFRIAISDNRIRRIENGKVHFNWKNNHTNKFGVMKLDIDEFIRRFLQHALPKGFFKVRYYGILANRSRKKNIEICKTLLAEEKDEAKAEAIEDGKIVWEKVDNIWDEILETIKTYKKPNCPVCKKGHMRFAGIVPLKVPG